MLGMTMEEFDYLKEIIEEKIADVELEKPIYFKETVEMLQSILEKIENAK